MSHILDLHKNKPEALLLMSKQILRKKIIKEWDIK